MLSLVLAIAIATPTPTPAERIARGEEAMASLDYDVAADELTLAASDPAATEDEKLRASLIAGIASVIVNRIDMARVHFRYVLLRAPATNLGDEQPQKVTSFFALVRNELVAEQAQAARQEAARAPEPVAPREAPVDEQMPLPAIVAGAGAAVLAGGLALAGGAELALGDAAMPLVDRGGWLAAGRAGLVVVALGAVVAIAGGTLALVE